VSLGSAWAVGGLAPLSIGVSNGRGGLIGSGTNAPLYTTSFLSAAPKAEEDRDKHESRLAKALKMDRIRRVFDFVDASISPECVFTGKRKYAESYSRTVWSGAEWVMEGRRASEWRLPCKLGSSFWLKTDCHDIEPKKTQQMRMLPTAPFK
jgi:meiosis-specific APC/C activator protein AMA1